jgi:predicted RNA-binding Zn-ribbon protein involved in translation (DUF1610 family)
LNQIVIEQIPNLADLLKTLEQLSIMNTNAQTGMNPFVVQQIPELRKKICSDKNWKEIAEHQLEQYFSRSNQTAELELLVECAELYSSQGVEALSDGFKCANCGQAASNRCSRCKSVWYCSKECQVGHYKAGHKGVCQQLAKKLEEKQSKVAETGQNIVIGNSKNGGIKKTTENEDQKAETKPKPIIEELNSEETPEDKSGNAKVSQAKAAKLFSQAEVSEEKNRDLVNERLIEEKTNQLEELD